MFLLLATTLHTTLTGFPGAPMMAPAMATEHPVDVLQAARRNARYRCGLDQAELARLASAVRRLAAVDLDLEFSLDDHGRVRLSGRVAARAAVVCSRCLLDKDVAWQAPVASVLVVEPDPAQLPAADRSGGTDGADMVVLTALQVELAELVEDDLLLALPERACDDEQCPNAPVMSYPASGETDEPGERQSPFAALQALRSETGEEDQKEDQKEDQEEDV